MSNRWWSKAANGNWNDANSWATTEGGDPTGVATPTSVDDVFFSSTNNYNCAVAAAADCKSLTFNVGTGKYTGTFSGSSTLVVRGSLTLASTMNRTFSGPLFLGYGGATTGLITCDTKTLASQVFFDGSSNTLQDNFTTTLAITHRWGGVVLNTYTLVGASYLCNTAVTKTLDLTNSVLSLSGSFTYSGSNLTLIVPGSTIKIAGTGSFAGNGQTYYDLELNGTAHTISGSNTFHELKSTTSSTTKTVTLTVATTQTLTNWNMSGDATHTTTIVSSSAGSPAYLVASGAVTADYLSIKDSQASGTAAWKAGINSIEVSGNSGWYFPLANPTNAYADDGNYATATIVTSGLVGIQLSWDAGTSWTSTLTKTFGAGETTETFGAGSSELWGRTWVGSDTSDANFRLKITCGNKQQIYKTYGFALGAADFILGIEVAVKGYWTVGSSTTSVNHIKVKIYYGNSVLPAQAGAQVFASNGRKNGEGGGTGTGVLCFYDGTAWRACDTGATVAA